MEPEEVNVGINAAKIYEKLLVDKEMTIADIARKLGVGRYSVHLFLTNLKNGTSSLKTICKYANALGVSPYVLFYENKLVPREPEKGGRKWK